MPSEIKLETSEQVLKDIDLKQMKKIRALYTRGWNSTTDKIKKLDKSPNKSAGLKKQELESLRKKIHQEQKIIFPVPESPWKQKLSTWHFDSIPSLPDSLILCVSAILALSKKVRRCYERIRSVCRADHQSAGAYDQEISERD